MSISWAQGLLAGAEGVANYSVQEKNRRQKRIDRTTELRDQMKMHQAKSKYSIEIKDYEDNRKLMKSLKGVNAGGYAEQFALHRASGLDAETASRMASASMKSGKDKLTRPKALEMPKLLMEATKDRQASSPIQDWSQSFSRGLRGEEPIEEVKPLPQDPQVPVASEVPVAAKEPALASIPDTNIDPVVSEAQADFVDPLAAPKQWTTVWTPQTIDGERFLVAQQSAKDGDTRIGESYPLGADVPEDADIRVIKNGERTDIYEFNPDTKSMEFLQSVDSKSATTSSPKAKSVSLESVNRFVEDQFNQVFSPVQNYYNDFGILGDTAESKQIKQAVSQDYVSTLANLEAAITVPAERIAAGNSLSLKAQGIAILRNVPNKDIVDMLKDTDTDLEDMLNVEVFRGDHAKNLGPILAEMKKGKDAKSVEVTKKLRMYMQEAASKVTKVEEPEVKDTPPVKDVDPNVPPTTMQIGDVWKGHKWNGGPKWEDSSWEKQ